MKSRKAVGSAVALAVAVGLMGVSVWHRATAEETSTLRTPALETVDPSVPEAKLLQSVLYIDTWRQFGNPVGFSYVPESRPPGLISVGPGNPPNLTGGSHRGASGGPVVDFYDSKVGGYRLFAVAKFSAGATSTCGDTKGMTHAVCVRDRVLSEPSPTDADVRHLTVYFTGDSDAVFTTTEAEKAKRFWADVEMVPVGEATWFTDLVRRARAAVQR